MAKFTDDATKLLGYVGGKKTSTLSLTASQDYVLSSQIRKGRTSRKLSRFLPLREHLHRPVSSR